MGTTSAAGKLQGLFRLDALGIEDYELWTIRSALLAAASFVAADRPTAGQAACACAAG